MELLIEQRVSEADMPQLASDILNIDQEIRIFTFQGNLGAGKTTLIKELCRVWDTTDKVSSPTFGLINLYHTAHQEYQVCHSDLYRLKHAYEIENIGIWDYIDDPDIKCCLEWPELLLDELSLSYIHIELNHTEHNDRICRVFTCNN